MELLVALFLAPVFVVGYYFFKIFGEVLIIIINVFFIIFIVLLIIRLFLIL